MELQEGFCDNHFYIISKDDCDKYSSSPAVATCVCKNLFLFHSIVGHCGQGPRVEHNRCSIVAVEPVSQAVVIALI